MAEAGSRLKEVLVIGEQKRAVEAGAVEAPTENERMLRVAAADISDGGSKASPNQQKAADVGMWWCCYWVCDMIP